MILKTDALFIVESMKHSIYSYILLIGISLFLFSCKKDMSPIRSDYCNLSVGVFGGSISSRLESQAAKDMWIKEFGFTVVTHGVGGAGFSGQILNNVPSQIENAPIYDIYILWASTNDARKSTVGDLETLDISTQNGGIRKCVDIIKNKNENAKILFLISMYCFDKYYEILTPFIVSQIELCEKIGLPYLDQSLFYNKENFSEYFLADKIHLKREGYVKIAPIQIIFFYENLSAAH